MNSVILNNFDGIISNFREFYFNIKSCINDLNDIDLYKIGKAVTNNNIITRKINNYSISNKISYYNGDSLKYITDLKCNIIKCRDFDKRVFEKYGSSINYNYISKHIYLYTLPYTKQTLINPIILNWDIFKFEKIKYDNYLNLYIETEYVSVNNFRFPHELRLFSTQKTEGKKIKISLSDTTFKFNITKGCNFSKIFVKSCGGLKMLTISNKINCNITIDIEPEKDLNIVSDCIKLSNYLYMTETGNIIKLKISNKYNTVIDFPLHSGAYIYNHWINMDGIVNVY